MTVSTCRKKRLKNRKKFLQAKNPPPPYGMKNSFKTTFQKVTLLRVVEMNFRAFFLLYKNFY